MPPLIRSATLDDAASIHAIYAPVVRDTWISFELDIPPVDEMRDRIRDRLTQMPWLVCELDGQVAGYAYAGKFKDRAAYQWSVEVSVYVHPLVQRRRVGQALYTSLFAALRLQRLYRAFAGIALPNDASLRLHQAVGFQAVGVYQQVGYKLGAWRDVSWWELTLQPLPADPLPPLDFATVLALPDWHAALAAGLPLIRG